MNDRSCLSVDGSADRAQLAPDLRDDEGRRAFVDEQYRLHALGVYRRCLTMGGNNASWAADRTQEVFVRLMEKLATLDTTKPMANWLLTVADRVCVDRLRRERGIWGRVKEALRLQVSVTSEPTAAADVIHESNDKLAHLRRVLATLPANEHAAVIMKYVDGRKQTEIAAALSCSEGTVSKLLTRAMRRLNQSFEDTNV